VNGARGEDTLDGGFGNDLLRGGRGPDLFMFTTSLDPAQNVDSIVDFGLGADTIGLSQAIFTGIGGQLDADEFHVGASADSPSNRIVYDLQTGNLYFDPDGDGGDAQLLFAVLMTRYYLHNWGQ
jgi:Ca2+-binding RTX toxin-like protein